MGGSGGDGAIPDFGFGNSTGEKKNKTDGNRAKRLLKWHVKVIRGAVDGRRLCYSHSSLSLRYTEPVEGS